VTVDTIAAGPAEDPIGLERRIGGCRASITLMSGATVTADWAAGDCQALRRLVLALKDELDVATAEVAAARRRVTEMHAHNRVVLDQRAEAIDATIKTLFERDQLRAELDATRRRADAAEAQAHLMEEEIAELTTIVLPNPFETPDAGQIRKRAVEAVQAAEHAFEEKSWKEGKRYLKLANTWTALLPTAPSAPSSPAAPLE
jgi:chromosome segregation ATPase